MRDSGKAPNTIRKSGFDDREKLDAAVGVVSRIAAMTSAAAKSEQVQVGHLAIVHGHSAEAEAVAAHARKQCEMRGFVATNRDLDTFEPGTAPLYNQLVLVMPASVPEGAPQERLLRQDLEKFTKIIDCFRNARPNGLSAMDAASDTPTILHVGVIQLLLILAAGDGPVPAGLLSALQARACEVRTLRGPEEHFDLFDILARPQRPAPASPTVDAKEQKNWDTVTEWGIRTPEQVLDVFRMITEFRRNFDDGSFTRMRAPSPHLVGNQLDIVLRWPPVILPREQEWTDEQYKAERKTFKSTGARAYRRLVEHVQQKYPDFDRPAPRRDAKDATKDVAKFHHALEQLNAIIRASARTVNHESDE